MATYDQANEPTPEQIREARRPILEKFTGNITIIWKPGEQQQYQEAMQLATQLAILNKSKFDGTEDGEKRAAFRVSLAQQVNLFMVTGEKPPELASLNHDQGELAEKISAILPLWADKAANPDDKKKRSAYVAQVYKAKLEVGSSHQQDTQTLTLAEIILFTVADNLAIKDLQQQTPSPVPRI